MSETSQVASETTPCRGHRWFEPVAPSLVIAVMAFANLVYRVVISRPGYFWQDDFYITAWAKYNPFGPDYLFLPFSDHFQPLGFALAWFSQRMFPGSYTAAMLWTAVLYALSIWVMYRLLLSIFGWRPQMTLVLVFYGFSIFTVQSYLWYAASLYLAPYLVLLPLGLLCAVHYLRAPGALRLLAVLGSSALVVSSHTFGLALPILTGLLLAVGALGSAVGPWWRRVIGQWRLLVVQFLPSLAVMAYYLHRSAEGRGITLEPLQALLFIGRQMIWIVIPGLAGGPWRYNGYLSPEFPILTPLAGFLVIEFIVVLVLLAWFRPRAFWLWLGALGVIGGQLLAVTLGRGGGDTALVVRYASPGLVALTLALSFTLMTDAQGAFTWRGWGERLANTWRGWGPAGQFIAVALLMQAYLVSFSVSLFTPVIETPFAINRAYMEPLIASAARVPSDVRLIPQFVPNRVVGVNAPGPTSTELVLASQPVTPGFADSVRGRLWGFTEEGELVEQSVWGVEARRQLDADCVTRLQGDSAIVPLRERAEYWYATLSLGTLAERDTVVRVELLNAGAVEGVAELAISPGLERTYAPLIGAGDALRVTPKDGTPVCVTDVVVGERFHWDDGWVQDPSSLPTQSFKLGGS